jgi:hypothetical protein
VKRSIAVLALAAAVAAVLMVPAATAKDARGPACTNFVSGDASYSTTTQTVTVEMKLDAPGCTGIYLLDIYNLAGDTQLANNVEPSAFTADPESGNTIVNFTYTFSSGAPSDGVCLVVESYHRGHVADRAPDTDCQPVDATSGGGGQGFS